MTKLDISKIFHPEPLKTDNPAITRCWANNDLLSGQCYEKVPSDPNHIGLCNKCRERIMDR